jgi:hypothetical protein
VSGDTFIMIGDADHRQEDMYVHRDDHQASAADEDLIAAARNSLPDLVAGFGSIGAMRFHGAKLTAKKGRPVGR